MSLLSHSTHDHATSSLDDLLKIANPVRAGALAAFNVTAHPDEVLQIPLGTKGVLANFHGRSFVNPLHGSDDEFCRFIAKKTGLAVLDCSYRLGTENQFPSSIHDAEDAVRWILAHPEKFDISRLSISGFSAGGLLSLVVSSVLFPQGI
ncbi:lipase 2 [Aspergillus awamori]|uniref:Lipase 2 n=1 Tax=Aspergillus awamori TaxID=105351 RepID=A0A401KYI2_ASPAW|nr:lipase 2 [Aspergillus awamori]